MCTSCSTPQLASAPYRFCPLLSHFEYIDCWTCPGMSWVGHFSALTIATSHVGIWTPPDTVSSGHPSPHPNSVSISSAIFAWLMIVTDHDTPSVSIGLIYIVLRCRLVIIQYLCLYSKFLRQRSCIQFHVRQRVPSWWMETNFRQYSI